MSKQSRRPNRAARHLNRKSPLTKSPHRRTGPYWALALAAAVGLVVAVSIVGRGKNANAAGPLKVGAKAPLVSGRDVVTDREISSSQLAGKNVLYYLSEGVMCQACLVQIQSLQQHAAELRARGLTLVSITNDDAATLASTAKSYAITTPLIADTSGKIVRSFGVMGGIPAGVGMHSNTADHTFVLVDKDGYVRFIHDYPKMWIGVSDLFKALPKVN